MIASRARSLAAALQRLWHAPLPWWGLLLLCLAFGFAMRLLTWFPALCSGWVLLSGIWRLVKLEAGESDSHRRGSGER